MIKRITTPGVAKLGGVLAGISYRYNIPLLPLRITVIVLTIFTEFFLIVPYLILWWLLPKMHISHINEKKDKFNNSAQPYTANPYVKKKYDIEDVEVREVKEKDYNQ